MKTKSTASKQQLRVKSSVKAGGVSWNHNPMVARPAKGLRIKTNIKAGIGVCSKGRICAPADPNHNQTLARGLKVKTNVKAGSPDTGSSSGGSGGTGGSR